MTGLVRKASLLVVLGLLAATAALAGVPDPTMCTLPTFVDLVSYDASGNVYQGAPVTVVVNDAAGNPIQGCDVTISFNDDVMIYDTQESPIVVSARTVTLTSGSDGVVVFHIGGAGKNSGATGTYTGLAAATITACGVTLCTANVTAYDENGALGTPGVTGVDMSVWGIDYLSGLYIPRSDFNHNGALDGVDLSTWGIAYLAGYTYGNGTLQ